MVNLHIEALPGILGTQGEGLFIFRDLGRKHSFREQGAEEKHFRELGRKVVFFQGAGSKDPPW